MIKHSNTDIFILFLHGSIYFSCYFREARNMINGPLVVLVRNTLTQACRQ